MSATAALLGLLAAAAPVAAGAPGVARAPYGVTRTGLPVDRYVLRNRHGMRVGILTLGGAIDEIRVADARGRFANVVLALPDLAAYEARPNFGAIVGRYVNRIAHGGFSIDGVRYALSKDPEAIVSHGGTGNFSTKVWAAAPCAAPGCRAVTLRYTSADGENGFPGALTVAVTYTLGDDDALRLDYRAETTRPTVVNLTNHSYFNLAGGTSGNADGQRIQILAAAITAIDDRRLPTGALRPVEATPFDLRQPTRIGDRIAAADPMLALAHGFDHNFVLDRPAGEALPVAARAWDPASGRTLEVRTSEPGLQFYTANGFDGSLAGAGGRMLRQGDGYALETQHFPDSPNRPEFPSTLLRPGQVYHSVTIYRFGHERRRRTAR